jgi:hypothetical protein
MTKPVCSEQRQESVNNNVRYIVSAVSRGNGSLQQGEFIMDSGLAKLREETDKIDFCRQ